MSYTVQIAADQTLPQITNAVRFEEAASSQFQMSAITAAGGSNVNLATFLELAGGAVPNDITFIASGGAIPAGSGVIWTGRMLVSGTDTAVQAYRAN